MQNNNGKEESAKQETGTGSAEAAGDILRTRRMGRNISLEEVSEATGISVAVLRALENDDRDQLPAEVYTRAFYKKFAEYLGLDLEEIKAAYAQQAGSPQKAGRRSGFNTVITLKGKEEIQLGDTLRRISLPIAILVIGTLLFFVYKHFLAPYNPFG